MHELKLDGRRAAWERRDPKGLEGVGDAMKVLFGLPFIDACKSREAWQRTHILSWRVRPRPGRRAASGLYEGQLSTVHVESHLSLCESKMSANAIDEKSQVDINYRAFQTKLSELLCTHPGKLALMHDGDVIEFFDSYADAVKFGVEKYSEIRNFSVQEVTNSVVSMGLYSHVGHVQ